MSQFLRGTYAVAARWLKYKIRNNRHCCHGHGATIKKPLYVGNGYFPILLPRHFLNMDKAVYYNRAYQSSQWN